MNLILQTLAAIVAVILGSLLILGLYVIYAVVIMLPFYLAWQLLTYLF